MRLFNKKDAFLLLLFCVFSNSILKAQHQFTVQADKPTGNVSSTMWGIFFEDINMGADGGIYAELVKNRSFEFQKPLMGWTIQQKKAKEGSFLILSRRNTNTANPRFLRLNAENYASGDFVLTNEGFRGMGIKEGLRYDFSMMYHQENAGTKFKIQLIDSAKNIIGSTMVEPKEAGTAWHTIEASFFASKTVQKAKLQILIEGNGTIDIDMVSLFPSDTWKGRKKGMRADMIQALADMKPGFIRFPGGCIVEGFDLNQRYRWKNTIGSLEERQLIINRWNFEFAHRPAPDYFQTFGLGFFEYFQLAEDIGAEPLPILNCGMACQYNSAELAPMDELEPYIQDILDLIEFANGSVSSKWGKIRANMGHPEPFNLKILGVGNENWGPQYIERAKLFQQRIKALYPNIKLVFSSGTDPNGERFECLNGELRKMNADLIDEHYYRTPDWFLANAKRYDNYPRNASKVFAGEYAAQSDKTVSVNNKNNWYAAISEAAFMTGLERNAEVVNMASYAPLFAHVDGWQWTPDLIWVNNLSVNKTPNYYVQQLYSLNKGNKTIPILLDNENVAGQDSLYASAVIDTAQKQIIIKLVNLSNKQLNEKIQLAGKLKLKQDFEQVVLSGAITKTNNFNSNDNIVPVTTNGKLSKGLIQFTVAPYSLNVLKIPFL